MTPARPTRQSTAGRAYLDLQNLARRTGRVTAELHQYYVLECFLDRLVRSTHADRFVLKGGVLLAAYDTRRPTRDIDLRGRNVEGSPEAVRLVVIEVASLGIDDGVVFDTHAARAEAIRDEDEYQGVRVVMGAELAGARMVFHVDVNVGDPVVPPARKVELPRLLGGTLRVAGYPLAMVHAEKILTAVERGTANTRWRDFADIATLAARHDIDGTDLDTALRTVAAHRRVQVESLADLLADYPALAQRKWAAWLRKQQLADRQPESFADVLTAVAAFADPALTGSVVGKTWYAADGTWRIE